MHTLRSETTEHVAYPQKAYVEHRDIAQVLRAGARYGYDRHAAELGLGMTGKAWRKEGATWLSMHKRVLGDPDRVFDVTLKRTGPVTGYSKVVDGQPIVVFLRRGTLDYASTWRASPAQMLAWGLA